MEKSNVSRKLRPYVKWFFEFFTYSVKMLVTHPLAYLSSLPNVITYNFPVGRAKPAGAMKSFAATQIQDAAEFFSKNGFVVIANALPPDEIAWLKKLVHDKADEMISLDNLGKLPGSCKHGIMRYSYGDYEHQSSWERLAFNPAVVCILEAIWKGRDFSAVTAGGDFVRPGGIYQPLHSDMGWQAAGGKVPSIITVNYYVTTVNFENGPIRQIPATQRFPVPSPWVVNAEPEWMKNSLVIAPAGTAIIRDPRGWHGGTPNISSEIRCMPNCGYVLRDAPLKHLGTGGVFQRVSRHELIRDFDNSKVARSGT